MDDSEINFIYFHIALKKWTQHEICGSPIVRVIWYNVWTKKNKLLVVFPFRNNITNPGNKLLKQYRYNIM